MNQNVVRLPRKVWAGEAKRAGNRGLGRPKGLPNKNTTLLKTAIVEAAELAGRDVRPGDPATQGLVSYLRWLAVQEAPAFVTLLGKVLPLQVAGDRDNPVETHSTIEIKIVDPD